MNNRAIAQCGAHLLLGEHCRAAPTTAPLQPAPTLYTRDSAVTKPWTQSRPFTSAFGFLSSKMSNGASVNEIFIPPNRTRVCCSVLGRRQGCCLCSCCLSLGESKSYFFAHENHPPYGKRVGAGSHAALSDGAMLSLLLAKLIQKCSEKIPCEPPAYFSLHEQGTAFAPHKFHKSVHVLLLTKPDYSVLRVLCSRTGKPSCMNVPAGHHQFSPYEAGHAPVN